MEFQPNEPISWRLHLPLPPARVYEGLNSNDGRAAFWAESAAEREGVIHFEFISGIRHASRIVERAAPRVWAIEYFGGVARFQLMDDGDGGTDLTLTHTGVAAEEWHETHAGWLNVLFPLKAWLVHGVDLRNHDPRRTWDQRYADQ